MIAETRRALPPAGAGAGWPWQASAGCVTLAFRADLALTTDEGAGLTAQWSSGSLGLGHPSAAVRSALDRLAGGVTVDELAGQVLAQAGPMEAAVLRVQLARLGAAGTLTATVGTDQPLATLLPSVARSGTPGWPDPRQRLVLSRFAHIQADGGAMVLASPLSANTLRIHDPAVLILVHTLARPCGLAELSERHSEWSAQVLEALVACLHLAGALAPADEDVPASLRAWEPQDLIFHTRSRRGRHDRPYGATWRDLGDWAPPPPLRASQGEVIALDLPAANEGQSPGMASSPVAAGSDQASSGGACTPLASVLDARRSLRSFGEPPIRCDELADLLFRSARVLAPPAPGDHPGEWRTYRPYPSAGACHALEVYPLVHRCLGLAPGLYRYDPLGHALEAVCTDASLLAPLLDEARSAAGLAAPPQVLLVLAARFGRSTGKYESMAYAGLLKDVGGLLQTLYLVATALGLAPCALGGGDAEAFARAAGTEYHAETSVGEMVIGSRPATGAP